MYPDSGPLASSSTTRSSRRWLPTSFSSDRGLTRPRGDEQCHDARLAMPRATSPQRPAVDEDPSTHDGLQKASWCRFQPVCATLGQVECDVLARVRGIALALPRVMERVSHGAPCFFVAGTPIGYFHDHHGGDDRVSLWCPARAGVQAAYTAAEPERYFAPSPSARGTFSLWLGAYLDLEAEPGVDWDEITLLLEEAFRQAASAAAIAELDWGRT